MSGITKALGRKPSEDYHVMVNYILKHGLTQEELAFKCDEVTTHTVWNWTKGTVPNNLRVRRTIKRIYKSLLANQEGKSKCAKCGGGFYDGEVFAVVSPAIYNADLNDAEDTGKSENYHYKCLEKTEGKKC